ncbi:MAG: SMEK domain-containing protein [Alistipes sp.]|nr:SMEK domain-containing protein [Alistipes sp.]
MNRQETLFRISQLLSRFTEQVKILNSNGEFSINIHAENILINILNIIYDCNLKNVNYEENKIYPSIDLRDYDKRIAIQVTSTSSLDKIKHTLSGFISNELYKNFDTLYVYIITEKQKKYKQSSIDEIIGDKIKFTTGCIIDKTDLYKILNAQNDDQNIINVCKLLESQFADNKNEFDKWELYCKGLYEYDQYIKNLYTYFDIKGFSPRVNNTLVRLNIDKIYVPLKFKFDFSNNSDENIPKDKKTSYDIITALTNFDKIVILGDPGSGKSTTLKYLAYTICAHRAGNEQLQTYIPIYLKATEFAKYLFDTGRSLSEFIIDINTKYGLLFSKSLENNKLIVLIDGLDEINITNQRHNVVEKINSFTAQYPEIKIIVSSRIVGYKETRLSGYFFHFEVDKFSDKQIYLFLNNCIIGKTICTTL